MEHLIIITEYIKYFIYLIDQKRNYCLPTIVPFHLTFVTIKFVIGTTNKLAFSATDLVAKCGSTTMLRWHLNHPLTACLAS